MKSWEIKKWSNRPTQTRTLALVCPSCGTDAEIEVSDAPGALIIAAIGLRIIFDPPGHRPPPNFMPDEIRCRSCRNVFSAEGGV